MFNSPYTSDQLPITRFLEDLWAQSQTGRLAGHRFQAISNEPKHSIMFRLPFESYLVRKKPVPFATRPPLWAPSGFLRLCSDSAHRHVPSITPAGSNTIPILNPVKTGARSHPH